MWRGNPEEDHWSQVQMDQDTGGDVAAEGGFAPETSAGETLLPDFGDSGEWFDESGDSPSEPLGELTAEEMAMLAKRRERQAASRRKWLRPRRPWASRQRTPR